MSLPESILIANRGEIAVRIIRSARDLGLRTIAVYSELDRDALHAELADEAWNIGPAPAADSYLNARRILEVASESGAASVHPGYGFLAENAEFAQAVVDEGLVWIGPPPAAIATMGDKIASRKAAEAVGVHTVPGTSQPVESSEEAVRAATEFGLPVAVKAAHGGGGKGMRVVHTLEDLPEAVTAASREAEAYFGKPAVYIERYLEEPRHIEAQIFADQQGNTVFLGERDCSVQRRHQKLIEEAPAANLDDKIRKAIGKAAVAVAKACDFVGAGTVEFLVEPDGSFWFLEMNTRLQVEHTVTEMVTGLDLVAEQIRVAAGEPLSFKRSEPRGHAIEFRVNAEDPSAGFLPSPGQIVEYREPSGPGVRVDGWVRSGIRISQYYDNLLAKLIVWGPDRETAIARSRRALGEFTVSGIATTIPAHIQLVNEPTFLVGRHYTSWLEKEVDFSTASGERSPELPEELEMVERSMTVEVGGRRFVVTYWSPDVGPSGGAKRPTARLRPPKLRKSSAPVGVDAGVIIAPMQGTIVKVHVKAGDSVDANDPICVLEAMKMENEVRTPIAGDVVDLRIRAGDAVSGGSVMAVIR